MKARPRINRWTEARRELLFGDFSLKSLVQPHFVVEGSNVDNPVNGMEGIHQQSVDVLIETVRKDMEHGLTAIMLFGVVEQADKDEHATKASDTTSHLHEAIKQIRSEFGDTIVIMTDVCLCTATNHGHCGLVEHGHIVNDASVDRLCEIAVSHAQAGADYVCASDMMDGRVSAFDSPSKLQIIPVRGSYPIPSNTHPPSMGRFVMLQTQAQNSVIVQRIK